jgi:hypothetical protein
MNLNFPFHLQIGNEQAASEVRGVSTKTTQLSFPIHQLSKFKSLKMYFFVEPQRVSLLFVFLYFVLRHVIKMPKACNLVITSSFG